jgi:hypothetical protein
VYLAKLILVHDFPAVTEIFVFILSRIQRIKREKKEKDREQKEMELANRKHLANMRVIQKNLAYVIGLHPKYATEEVLYNDLSYLNLLVSLTFLSLDYSVKRLLWAIWKNLKACD